MHEEMDRRDTNSRTMIVERLRAEFEHMPGIALTAAQVARLENVPVEVCQRVLSALAEQLEVVRRDDGRFTAPRD
jgi:hypothetical protein